MAKWNVDVSHTNVGFQVKHMMVSKVRGNFTDFSGTIEGNPEDLATAKVDFEVKLDSINTSNENRDNHLRSADFFEVEKYPKMTFTSTDIKEKGNNEYDLVGDLTIKGVTKEVSFDTVFEGKGVYPNGNEVVGFTANGKIDRKEFGLTWNQALETGGFVVGDNIDISIEVEANPAK